MIIILSFAALISIAARSDWQSSNPLGLYSFLLPSLEESLACEDLVALCHE